MMRVNLSIANAGNVQIEQAMFGKQCQHVVEKADTVLDRTFA